VNVCFDTDASRTESIKERNVTLVVVMGVNRDGVGIAEEGLVGIVPKFRAFICEAAEADVVWVVRYTNSIFAKVVDIDEFADASIQQLAGVGYICEGVNAQAE
jgi:hypothetical protein